MSADHNRESSASKALESFAPPVREWFEAVFDAPTRPQTLGWPAIARGDSTLILAPTGTGKTLTAFLWAIDRVMFALAPEPKNRCRVLYISPIKALAVDVERNLRAPLVGIAQAAKRMGVDFHEPVVAVRTGDTPSNERARFNRHPGDILITTPESLFLMLTSRASEALKSVETVIIDEIHALVPTKRGSHLALSLERLEHLCGRKLQRVGLSATQRPLEEVARFLGGVDVSSSSDSDDHDKDGAIRYRPVTIVDASEKKRLELRVEVPLEDMTQLDKLDPLPSGPASQGPVRPSIWSAIHPKLVELVQQHRSTLIFVNSRRLAERISGAMNEIAGTTLVRAHHGSVAVAQRKEIEDRLKQGTLRGLVATSSLELGIDMGAVDLVVQIESPPSVASGMQRIGRASHHVGAISKGIIFPKYRADLLACAAVVQAMYEGKVESVRYPRNPLDVLAQQIVACVVMQPWRVVDLYALIRSTATYATLSYELFENVLDMLSGRYPSDEFAELRPRVTWDRVAGTLATREGARGVVIANAGTIPDRGLYGVFLAGAEKGGRVGELDEEMVYESRTGDTIILGASTWRIEQITHDRVLVSPAPGEPGKMPFWHGDTAGRPAEFGKQIGAMARELLEMPRAAAFNLLIQQHSLDENAAENVLRYVEDQKAATGRVPSDKDIIVERTRDELGDWRICVLSPFGSKVHAPWCLAVTAKLRSEYGLEPESMWSEDGFVIRLPDSDSVLDSELLFPSANEIETLVTRQLGSTSIFAARFREAAGRALLLPRRRPGMRAPLWQQRKRAADLLSVASRFSAFPLILETYRECLRDVFDLPAAVALLRSVEERQIRVTTVDSERPSPFASSLLFAYIANYIYEGDAPLAERRAQALSIDQSQLQELLGDTDFRELLEPAVLDEVAAQLQSLDPEYLVRHADGLHDLLLRLGDLSADEIQQRSEVNAAELIQQLDSQRRILRIRVAGGTRYIAAEDAGRYRDALGVPLPPGLPEAFTKTVEEPLASLLRRYARTHIPFTTAEAAARFGSDARETERTLAALHSAGKLLEGEFRPTGSNREWCDPEVLRILRRKTLARLRREVEPVEEQAFARMLTHWQGVIRKRKGADAILDAVEILQGAPIPATALESEVLPARIDNYSPADLDQLIAAGEIIWVGLEPIGQHDGRVALYTAANPPQLLPPPEVRKQPELSERAQKILNGLRQRGASFFPVLHELAGGGFPGETVDALWELVWAGLITNDTYAPVRALITKRASERESRKAGSAEFVKRFKSRSATQGPAQGRWSLVEHRRPVSPNVTEWSAALAQQLLVRYGIVTREAAVAEDVPGGFSSVYTTLKTMEESGFIRRGMFVAGQGAAQFAMPAAIDLLRTKRTQNDQHEAVHLASTDTSNPYGALLRWPQQQREDATMLARAAGASVILVDGRLAAYFRRRSEEITVFLPEEEPDRSRVSQALAEMLAKVAVKRLRRKSGLLIGSINGQPAREHPLARVLADAGFVDTAHGFQMRRDQIPLSISREEEALAEDGDDLQESA